MIEIDFSNETYTCPFCNCKQAFAKSSYYVDTHLMNSSYLDCVPELYRPSTFRIYSLVCCNSDCCKVSVVAVNRFTKKQVDVFPQYAFRHYPDYIPEQIRNDYKEACAIIDLSPKAAATLLRRCLQGMIRDFYGIKCGKLNEEIDRIKKEISSDLREALDSLREIGNIGAHMEKDVNLIIDIVVKINILTI